jgi:hypothetical protein
VAFIAYLPLAHVLEVTAETALLGLGASLGYSNPGTITATGRYIPLPGESQLDLVTVYSVELRLDVQKLACRR